ncbi:hypothetical protein [Nocardia bhagyanarayanae]|uniref:Uncharacterized protein n=1 Tax=Nocardia bhagyanarayanae TaxID=1215925 RepID=A0A543FFY4_9NOCA|nr:hypothetical protein [Nocardia bhagyanarayanae]TQM32664.1 hypothetical protein FB390_4359 [Nocardia bhagyanarayanae]
MLTDLHCPHCGMDDQVQAVPALYAAGTYFAHGTGDYNGLGFTSYGPVAVFGTATITRIHATTLARSLPPEPVPQPTTGYLTWGTAALLLPILVSLPLLASLSDVPENMSRSQVLFAIVCTVAILSIPSVACFATAGVRMRQRHRITRGRRAAHALWSAGVYCHRCGYCFWPTAVATGIPIRQPVSTADFTRLVWDAGRYHKRQTTHPLVSVTGR